MKVQVQHLGTSRVLSLELPGELNLGSVMALLAEELALNQEDAMMVLCRGQQLRDHTATLATLGVREGDSLVVSTVGEVGTALTQMSMPYMERQRKMEERIRQQNVDSLWAQAMEHMPESFGSVVMLYVDVKVNGIPLKAFVDSGAQMTIMSQQCADRCDISRLIDHRFQGMAVGVGQQKILGRVHMCQLEVAKSFLTTSFSVLEDQNMDMILGLDMLRRHQCNIDLAQGVLRIGTTGTSTPFLPEADLPEFAKPPRPPMSPSAQTVHPPVAPNPAPAAPAAGSAHSATTEEYPEYIIENLMQMGGFSRTQALEALRVCNGDGEAAAAYLVNTFLSG